jgi:peptidoglycan/LPS O-acetylase OafA/YrhL
MGITEILSSVGNVILRWEKTRLYWPHTILVLLVFVFHFQEWWIIYELRFFKAWRLPVFLFTILYPVNLYIIARIIFPRKYKGKVTDFKEFYYANCKRIFVFIFSLALLSIIDNIFFQAIPFLQQIPQILLAIISLSVIVSNTKVELIHHVIILLLLIATIVTFIIEWDVLLIENT